MTCPMSHLMEQCGVIVFSCGTMFSINERFFIRHTNVIHTWYIVCSISALNFCFGIFDKVFCTLNIIYFVLEYIKLIKLRSITLDLFDIKYIKHSKVSLYISSFTIKFYSTFVMFFKVFLEEQ